MFQPGPPIVLPKDGNKLDIGKVKTGFHEIDLVVLTESRVVSVVDEKVTEEVMTQSQRLVEDRCNDESDIGNVQSPAVKNPSDEDDYVPLRSDSTQSEIILENGKILRALASKKQSSGGSEHPKELTANNEQLDAEPAKNTTHMPEMVILAPTSIVIPEIQQDGKIDCICKSLSELGNLVQCDQCLSWCHLTCFGYKSAEDPELPASFKCHQCSSGLISNEDLYDLAIKRKILASVFQGFKSFRSLYDGVGLPSDSWAIRDKYRKWLESFGCVKALPKRKFDVQVEENLLQEFLNPKLNYLNKPQAGKQKVSIVSKDLVVTNA